MNFIRIFKIKKKEELNENEKFLLLYIERKIFVNIDYCRIIFMLVF